MKFMGSKNRIAKEILPIILKDRHPNQYYVEPFCGGCNLIDKVEGNRIANDKHTELILMFRALQAGWSPPKKVSRQEYQLAKNIDDPVLKAYIGYNLSFGAKWFGGYARHNDGGKRCASTEAYNNVMKQVPNLLGIDFRHGEYTECSDIPENSLIYCDPPYKGTTKYKSSLNYTEFYVWCTLMKLTGHTVFISEYWMPSDFTCIWAKQQTTNLTNLTPASIAVEKLFTLL